MVERARQLGAKTVDLTSRPSREAANHLYRKAGFEVRDTNVYRLRLEGLIDRLAGQATETAARRSSKAMSFGKGWSLKNHGNNKPW